MSCNKTRPLIFPHNTSNLSSKTGYDHFMSSLRQRIVRTLDDHSVKIQHEDFEMCTISMLRNLYPNIEAVSGGTDGGLDGRVNQKDETVGVLVTSSRRPEGSRENLRKNLKSVSKNYPHIKAIIFASLARNTMYQRKKLEAIAQELGFTLIAAFDRDWFADQFYEYPDWRETILQIPGDPSCFSRKPPGWNQEFADRYTIGRESIINQINRAQRDVVLYGIPGIGKTHVAASLPNTAFINSYATGAHLIDDLIELRPGYVVVDDAGLNIEKLQLLRDIRHTEGLDFRLIATCWPHQESKVTKELNQAETVRIERLSRAEIGEILRGKGITRLALRSQILDQADGRPGWAINLANLVIQHQDLDAAWYGGGLQKAVEESMEKLGLNDQRSLAILGTLALIGDLDEREIAKFGELLGIPRTDVSGSLENIAKAGLIDVSLQRTYAVISTAKQPMNLYSTQPGLMRASLATAVYFSERNLPVSIVEVKDTFPEKLASILRAQCEGYFLKATRPCLPEFEEVKYLAVEHNDSSLLQLFSAIGPCQSVSCAEAILHRIQSCMEENDRKNALKSAQDFGNALAAMHWSKGSPVIEHLIGAFHILEVAGADCQSAISQLAKNLQTPLPGERPSAEKTIRLLRGIHNAPAPDDFGEVIARLTAALASPIVETISIDPESRSTFILTNGAWEPQTLKQIGEITDQILLSRWQYLPPKAQCQLLELLREWVQIAFRGTMFTLTPDQRDAAKNVALSLATTMSSSITDPGVRKLFNDAATPLNLKLEEPDELFTALVDEYDLRIDTTKAFEKHDAAIIRALAPYLDDEPQILVKWLKRHSASIHLVRNGEGVQALFRVLSSQNIDHHAWLLAAQVAGFVKESQPLLSECVKQNTLSTADLECIGGSMEGFQTLLETVIECSTDETILEHCLVRATADNFVHISHAAIWRSGTLARDQLFTHPNVTIRGRCAAIWAEWPNLDTQNTHWRKAITDYSFATAGASSSFSDEALWGILQGDVDLFTKLFRSALVNNNLDFTQWSYAIKSTDAPIKSRIWQNISTVPLSAEAFWVVAGNDITWVKSEVSNVGFKQTADDLLDAYMFALDTDYEVRELAEALRPLQPDADKFVYATEFRSYSGLESDKVQEYLDKFQKLSTDEDPYFSQIGKAGISRYEPRLSKAKKQEREAEVRGRLV